VIRILFAGLVAATALAGAAHARDASPRPESPDFKRCLASPAADNTVGILACIDAELKVQDARLNTAYRTNMANFVPGPGTAAKAAFLKAQRAWIVFRDADCASVLLQSDGTGAAINARMCLLDHTVSRAEALEAMLEP